jgi:hypothetical protein
MKSFLPLLAILGVVAGCHASNMNYVDPRPAETKAKWDPYVGKHIWIDYDAFGISRQWEFKDLLPAERAKLPAGEYGTIQSAATKRFWPNDECVITVKLDSGRVFEDIKVTAKLPGETIKEPPKETTPSEGAAVTPPPVASQVTYVCGCGIKKTVAADAPAPTCCGAMLKQQ